MATGSRSKNRTSKAEQSRATRRKIVDAATELFLDDGFVTTTMAAIAQRAGVAVQTLYLSFGNKTAILQAALDQALRGDEVVDIGEQDWFQRVLVEEDGPAALRLMCERSAEVIGRASPLFGVVRAASADPEVGELLTQNKRLRRDGYRQIIEAVTSRPGFSPDLTVEEAHGILYALLSEDSYLLLVVEHGWSQERWLGWVSDTCIGQLFPDA